MKLRLVDGIQKMRRAHHIHPEELMNPDLLSEILLLGSILLAGALLLVVLVHAFG